jgi:hypothetical protein
MPRGSELIKNGRGDLKQAMERHWGGYEQITKLAGMVPYNEWHYLEGQLRLMRLLQEYRSKYDVGGISGRDGEDEDDNNLFPNVSDIRRNGYHELFDLIRYYGGRSMIASRLGMALSTRKVYRRREDGLSQLNWGSFDVDFGIELLTYIRQQHMQRPPPWRVPLVSMPTVGQFKRSAEGESIHNRMSLYGGYENVARRLGLAYDFGNAPN